jgi:ATP-binding cassette, subfamily B, bacterial PglK
VRVSEPEVFPEESQPSNGSLNHVDFGKPSLIWAVRKGTNLLPEGKRHLLYIGAGVQLSLGLLDLLGIALIGLVAAVAVTGISPGALPEWAQSFLSFLGLENLTVSRLSVVIALAAVSVLVAKTVLSAVMTRIMTQFLANRQADLSVWLARAFLQRPLTEVQRWTTSEATYALGQGAGAATVSLLGSAIVIASEGFLFVIIGVSLLVFDPVLTLVSAAFFTLVVLLMHRVLARWSERNAAIIKDSSIGTLSAVSEALSTYREATVLNRRELYVARYEGVVNRYAGASAGNAFIMELPKYVLEVALYLGVLLLGVVQFLTKDWSAAATTTALFLAAGSRVIPSMLRLQGAGITIRMAAVMAQPTFFMYDQLHSTVTEPVHTDVQEFARNLHERVKKGYDDLHASVSVEHVSLTFSDAREPVLRDISLEVPAGSSAAFVGSTGAGKSTLADVILGVLQPDAGHVSIGGLSPRDAVNQWPGAISYVPQSVALVAGSVKQNVALGLPGDLIDERLVLEALERAHLSDFLDDEREGLNTLIGERGFKLSGGQRQRLGIARALYTRPSLLVLDEATSALDAETEQAIVATLGELEGDVTTITIAHRLATVRNVDLVCYMEKGAIVAQGTFSEVRDQSIEFANQASILGL